MTTVKFIFRARAACSPGLGQAALAALVVGIAGASPAIAQPSRCGSTADQAHRAAVDLAQAWFAARWQLSGKTWTTTYTLKPTAPVPLGIGSFGKLLREAGEPSTLSSGVPAQPVTGAAQVTAVTCTTYQMNSVAGPAYAIRYAGRRLRFDESASGWSRPLPNALLHVLTVSPGPSPGAAPVIQDLPEGRTALPPDMSLVLPAT